MHAVVHAQAVGQLRAKFLPQRLIFLTVVFQQLLQLAFNAPLQRPLYELQLPVMLQHLPADVQGKILTVHQAPHKAEIVRQQVGTLFHNKHAAGIKLQALLIAGGVVVHRGMAGDKQQGVKGGVALRPGMDHHRRVFIVVEFVLIEVIVLFRLYFALLLAPQRDHAV